MVRNPLKLMQIKKRISEKRMMMMVQKVTQVKEHRKKRMKHLRKKRKKMRMALPSKLRQKKEQKPL